jgi:hypothetical protein
MNLKGYETKKAGCLFLCCLPFNIVNNLPFEIIQDQWVDETKMRWVLRNLQHFKRSEMLDTKGF